MLLWDVVRTSQAVAATPRRLAKIELIAACLRDRRPEEVPVAVAYLSGVLPQGSIGVGWASLPDLSATAAPGEPTLQVLDVHRTFDRIAAAAGRGSQAARRALLSGLFERATDAERRFLMALLAGDLRQGALEGVMTEAVARAAGVPAAEIRRASMLTGDLGVVARTAIDRGADGLRSFRLTVLRPILPMLAQTADGIEDALGQIDPAAVERKLDGARIQVHRLGTDVRAFTRNLADVTDRLPEVIDAVRTLGPASMILDGEAIAIGSNGRPRPFLETMARFGSRSDTLSLRATTLLSAFFFDCLHADGEDLIDRPQRERSDALAAFLPPAMRVPRLVTGDVAAATAFLEDALTEGHEGVMVKSPDSVYEAGRRGAGWLKVKRAHTLDLVVLAAEWGHGRRKGWLSNLHLGARDPAVGGFVMLGKTFKGMTDATLAWQTEHLLALEIGRQGITVTVRPELVVEVAFDGVQTSPRYPAGLALRFARVKGYRPDKRPQDADTIDAVRAIHAGSLGA